MYQLQNTHLPRLQTVESLNILQVMQREIGFFAIRAKMISDKIGRPTVSEQTRHSNYIFI